MGRLHCGGSGEGGDRIFCFLWASKEIGGKGQRRAGTFLLKDAKRVVGDARRFLEYYVLLYTNLDVYYAKCRAQCGNC